MEREYTIKGFKASAVAAGIKKKGGLDLALIFSEKESVAAAVFTENQVKAAPVLLSQAHSKKGTARAVIANSGNANACTGNAGLADARRTADLVAEELGIVPEEVLVASTGVIGAPLDMEAMTSAIPGLVAGLSEEGISRAAEAIMTTDAFPKISGFRGTVGQKAYQIVGIAKGAGMISPRMATMLGFVMTDIRIDGEGLRRAVSTAAAATFNRITVDGDTSTNDMVVVMANGTAGNEGLSDSEYEEFQQGLTRVMEELATMIVKDGEGATKVVRITVKGAKSREDAARAARTVANSPLVKTAFYGGDPNWGRIMAALGRAGADMDEALVNISVNDVQIVAGGMGLGAEAEKSAAEIMAEAAFSLTIDLQRGPHREEIVTCDLSHEYISINADYRT
jgi:glutamate N-acetyltransferase/amino-acid N-acetyltransferase